MHNVFMIRPEPGLVSFPAAKAVFCQACEMVLNSPGRCGSNVRPISGFTPSREKYCGVTGSNWMRAGSAEPLRFTDPPPIIETYWKMPELLRSLYSGIERPTSRAPTPFESGGDHDCCEVPGTLRDDEISGNRVSVGAHIRDILDGHAILSPCRDLPCVERDSGVVVEVCRIVQTRCFSQEGTT
jgi:hypothetical protein